MLQLAPALMLMLLPSVTCRIPEGYILGITPDCGHDTDDPASVTVITDLTTDLTARCAGDVLVNFTAVSAVQFFLPISYPGAENSSLCVFNKRQDAEVYAIQIILAYGEIGNEVYTDEEVRTFTCTFDEKGDQVSDESTVQGRLISARELQFNSGDSTQSTLSLDMVDCVGNKFGSRSVHLGRKVYLHAKSDGASGEGGIRITNCDAIGINTGKRYQIIRVGCGDGVVIPQDEGFVTKGLKAQSPLFELFSLGVDKQIAFECNFSLCEEACDGSSCDNNRRKRDTPQSGDTYLYPDTRQRSGESQQVTLQLASISGEPVNDPYLFPRRKYRLLVSTSGESGEVGVSVDSCSYTTTRRPKSPVSGAVLRHGCSVDAIFNSTTLGFTTTGREALSDEFEAFNIGGDKRLAFRCRVVLCLDNCDGPSCPRRRKRDSRNDLNNVVVKLSRIIRSTPINLDEDPLSIEETN